MFHPPQSVARNRLLAALPPDVLNQLLPKLHRVPLPLRETLATPEEPIEAVYFVERGWVSLVANLDEGAQAEVGLIGREGMVGHTLVTGEDTAFAEAFVQAPGEALRMEAGAFRRALGTYPALFQRLLRHLEAMHAQIMQTAACNGRHPIEQRLARWILMAHDRAEDNDLPRVLLGKQARPNFRLSFIKITEMRPSRSNAFWCIGVGRVTIFSG